jgi:hypothetical protein
LELRHLREALAAGAGGPQQVRPRELRRRVRRAAARQGHPGVPEAGSEHHQQAACPRARVLRWAQASVIPPEQAVGLDVRQPGACRSAKASRPERFSVRRPAAGRSGPAAWFPEPALPSERARHSAPASAQAAFVPAAVKPGAAAGSELRAWSEAAEQHARAVPLKAAAPEAANAAAERRPEAEFAPSVQPEVEAAEVSGASPPAGEAASDVTVQGAAEAARPGAGAAVEQPWAAARSDVAAELPRAAEREAWLRAAAAPQVPWAPVSVFRQGRLRLPARPARSRWVLRCFVHATRSLRMASR